MAPSLNLLPKAVCLPLLILAWLSVMLAQGQGKLEIKLEDKVNGVYQERINKIALGCTCS